LLSRRNGLPNSRHRRRRTHRQLRVHRFSPVLQHNNRPADQRNQVRQYLGHPLNNHLPVCRQARQECHPLVQSALLLQEDQLSREQLSRRP
jgi:hypothetical protein